MNMDRRTFLRGALTLTAVAALPLGVLAETLPMIYGDGEHDDTAGLNALLAGKPFRTVDGFAGIAEEGLLYNGRFIISAPLCARRSHITVMGCSFDAGQHRMEAYVIIFPGSRYNLFQDCEFNNGHTTVAWIWHLSEEEAARWKPCP